MGRDLVVSHVPHAGSAQRPELVEEGMEDRGPDASVAIIDACVLVQVPLRDTLTRLAEAPALYRPRWSDEIAVEVI